MLRCNMLIPRIAKPGRFRPEHLLRPASVLVLGAETAAGVQVLANLRAAGFAGPVLSAETGADLATLPSAAELAVVCTDGDAVRDGIQAFKRGPPSVAVWIPAFFRRDDDDGSELRHSGARTKIAPALRPGYGLNTEPIRSAPVRARRIVRT